jgi:squalene-associated FAD-dependent desaturase
MTTQRVIVIGGGFAGLSAAVELARRGEKVLLLEARPGLGGRATAFTDRHTGERVDNGQHVLLGCYHETFAFLKTIGADQNVRLQTTLDVPFIDTQGRRSRLQCPALKPPWHLLGGLAEWSALGLRDRLAALKLAEPIRIARRQLHGEHALMAASPGETVQGWLMRNGQTPRLCEMLWEPLALAALNQSPREAAAPMFARVLAQMFGGAATDAAIGIPVRPLDEMYANPARAFIERRGGQVRTNAPAKIICDGERVSHVSVQDERLHADSVIVAVPWFALADLIVSPPALLEPALRAAVGMAASPIVTVNLWLDRQVLDSPFVGLPGRTMQWVFDKRDAFGNDASHLSLVSSGASDVFGRGNDELIALAFGEILEALPDARRARLTRATVVRERRATFSLAPGQPPRPGTRTGVQGLVLSGDWIDTGLPATIEGAVLSGRMAAEAVLKSQGSIPT